MIVIEISVEIWFKCWMWRVGVENVLKFPSKPESNYLVFLFRNSWNQRHLWWRNLHFTPRIRFYPSDFYHELKLVFFTNISKSLILSQNRVKHRKIRYSSVSDFYSDAKMTTSQHLEKYRETTFKTWILRLVRKNKIGCSDIGLDYTKSCAISNPDNYQQGVISVIEKSGCPIRRTIPLPKNDILVILSIYTKMILNSY